uniref:Methyltransferase domain-containing protein n=1 Tax=Phenylobacterium glaciei TaxID=2803784 RepID=A0A974P204_9CAUL|nr:hypothetical protein JKL49_21170 [Phenylobacterium glaciei]
MTGVDLSEGMLGKARDGGLYDELRVADLTDTLRQPGARWDMIAAGDTFPMSEPWVMCSTARRRP